MSFKLHVLTACTRPENLARVGASLQAWGNVDVTWHVRFDPHHKHIGGQAVKNAMLDEITDGWVWFLDDDCTAHRKLYRRVAVTEKQSGARAVIVSQLREDGTVLHAGHENVGVGTIDIGQAVIRRHVIGNFRIPEDYAGDGDFLIDVLGNTPGVVYVDEVLSNHNDIA